MYHGSLWVGFPIHFSFNFCCSILHKTPSSQWYHDVNQATKWQRSTMSPFAPNMKRSWIEATSSCIKEAVTMHWEANKKFSIPGDRLLFRVLNIVLDTMTWKGITCFLRFAPPRLSCDLRDFEPMTKSSAQMRCLWIRFTLPDIWDKDCTFGGSEWLITFYPIRSDTNPIYGTFSGREIPSQVGHLILFFKMICWVACRGSVYL